MLTKNVFAVHNESKSDFHKKQRTVSTTLVTQVGLFQQPSRLIPDDQVQFLGEQKGEVDTIKLLLNVATIKNEPRSP